MGNIIYQFEIEHIFAKALFGNDTIKTALNAAGITQEMRGNKIPLYQKEQTVTALQNGPAAFQQSVVNGITVTVTESIALLLGISKLRWLMSWCWSDFDCYFGFAGTGVYIVDSPGRSN